MARPICQYRIVSVCSLFVCKYSVDGVVFVDLFDEKRRVSSFYCCDYGYSLVGLVW